MVYGIIGNQIGSVENQNEDLRQTNRMYLKYGLFICTCVLLWIYEIFQKVLKTSFTDQDQGKISGFDCGNKSLYNR